MIETFEMCQIMALKGEKVLDGVKQDYTDPDILSILDKPTECFEFYNSYFLLVIVYELIKSDLKIRFKTFYEKMRSHAVTGTGGEVKKSIIGELYKSSKIFKELKKCVNNLQAEYPNIKTPKALSNKSYWEKWIYLEKTDEFKKVANLEVIDKIVKENKLDKLARRLYAENYRQEGSLLFYCWKQCITEFYEKLRGRDYTHWIEYREHKLLVMQVLTIFKRFRSEQKITDLKSIRKAIEISNAHEKMILDHLFYLSGERDIKIILNLFNALKPVEDYLIDGRKNPEIKEEVAEMCRKQEMNKDNKLYQLLVQASEAFSFIWPENFSKEVWEKDYVWEKGYGEYVKNSLEHLWFIEFCEYGDPLLDLDNNYYNIPHRAATPEETEWLERHCKDVTDKDIEMFKKVCSAEKRSLED